MITPLIAAFGLFLGHQDCPSVSATIGGYTVITSGSTNAGVATNYYECNYFTTNITGNTVVNTYLATSDDAAWTVVNIFSNSLDTFPWLNITTNEGYSTPRVVLTNGSQVRGVCVPLVITASTVAITQYSPPVYAGGSLLSNLSFSYRQYTNGIPSRLTTCIVANTNANTSTLDTSAFDTTYNTNMWLHGVKGISSIPQHSGAGMLVTPYHLIRCQHAGLLGGETIRFLGTNNVYYTNTVIDTIALARRTIAGSTNSFYSDYLLQPGATDPRQKIANVSDLSVSLLANPVSSNVETVSVIDCLTLTNKFGRINNSPMSGGSTAIVINGGMNFVPVITVNQYLDMFLMQSWNNIGFNWICRVYSSQNTWLNFEQPAWNRNLQTEGGDSGNPSFLLLGDTLYGVAVWSAVGSASTIGDITTIASITNAMNSLSDRYSSPRQTLQTLDMSGYPNQ